MVFVEWLPQREVITMITVSFVHAPGNNQQTTDTMLSIYIGLGWELIKTEDIGKSNIKFTVGWNKDGEPNHPPNEPIDNDN